MRVDEVLALKGDVVHTIAPGATVHEAAVILQDLNIGALVCTDPTGGVIGIVSERDVSRAVARHGWDCVDMAVSEIMVRDVIACRMEDEMDELLAMMTETRCRHLPVVRDGLVAGMISMGDLVKIRLG